MISSDSQRKSSREPVAPERPGPGPGNDFTRLRGEIVAGTWGPVGSAGYGWPSRVFLATSKTRVFGQTPTISSAFGPTAVTGT